MFWLETGEISLQSQKKNKRQVLPDDSQLSYLSLAYIYFDEAGSTRARARACACVPSLLVVILM